MAKMTVVGSIRSRAHVRTSGGGERTPDYVGQLAPHLNSQTPLSCDYTPIELERAQTKYSGVGALVKRVRIVVDTMDNIAVKTAPATGTPAIC